MTREEIVRSFQYNMTNAFIEGWYDKNHERYTEEIEDVFYEGAYAAQKYLIEKVYNELEVMEGQEVAECYRKIMEE